MRRMSDKSKLKTMYKIPDESSSKLLRFPKTRKVRESVTQKINGHGN